MIVGIIVLVGAIGAGVFALRGGGAPAVSGAPNAALRPLAVRDPPALPTGAGMPSDLSLVGADLKNNDCRTAAGRARQLRLANPSIGALQLLEGAAFVCAGDGAKAIKALEGARSEPSAPGRAEWLRAQAFLLEGRGAEAIAALKAAQAAAPDEATRVRGQLQQVEGALR
jgi:predicted Zn-dependent protease